MKSGKNQNLLFQKLSDCIRILAADAVEAAKSGHPGLPLGMADLMTVLALEFLKFNPDEPEWFNRDRLVLSAGHGSMLLYAFYYLAGYRGFSLEDIKRFRSLNSKAAGHPEHEVYEAIETTTGPLGQGFATAVGMAIAQKKYQAHIGKDISDYKIYAIVGDGCLMEGVTYEAASLAGHLKLDNLIVIFDDNGISIDGSTALAVSENHLAKFKAFGFSVEAVDGHNFDQIRETLQRAGKSTKPYFIACKTVIGKGVNLKAGTEKAHGSPLGSEEIKYLKDNSSFTHEPFKIEESLLDHWRSAGERSRDKFAKWQGAYDQLSLEERRYITEIKSSYDVPGYMDRLIPPSDALEATRVSSGRILQEIVKHNNKIICGSADLALSNNVLGANSKVINAKDFSGNFIHYGVREHAMGAIMSGLALSGFLPVGSTFLVFSDYMRPAIRLAAIMKIKVVYILTHDSIGVGEDGPTHQPVEHLASLRAMPNIKVFRPADFVETLECYMEALSCDGPSVLALSRQNLRQLRLDYDPENNRCAAGAYIVCEAQHAADIDVVIFASGSELSIGKEVQERLQSSYGKSVRLVSVPCFENLEQKGNSYRDELVSGAGLRVAIEAGTSFGWHKIIGENGLFFGLDRFGLSAPAEELYNYFGLTADIIVKKIINNF